MNYILLIGAALNIYGGLTMLKAVVTSLPLKTNPEDYIQLKIFVVGVAVTFASLYVYLFFNPEHIMPFLIFGAALKSWAFITSLYLYRTKTLSLKVFNDFGLPNGVVAILFWILLVHIA
jgi:hypothetical protein